MSETDIITDTNTETDGKFIITIANGHDSPDKLTIELETDTMVIELSDANMADNASFSMKPTGILLRKRGLSGGDIPAVNTSEGLSEISNIDTRRARTRALSGQQVYADALKKQTQKLDELFVPSQTPRR